MCHVWLSWQTRDVALALRKVFLLNYFLRKVFLLNFILFNMIVLVARSDDIWVGYHSVINQSSSWVWTVLTFCDWLRQRKRYLERFFVTSTFFVENIKRLVTALARNCSSVTDLPHWSVLFSDVEKKIILIQFVIFRLHGGPFPCFQRGKLFHRITWQYILLW